MMEFKIRYLVGLVAMVLRPVNCLSSGLAENTTTSSTIAAPKTSSKGLSPALASALADLMASGGGEAQALGQLVGLGNPNRQPNALADPPMAFGARRMYYHQAK
jgi:hypothetical protein